MCNSELLFIILEKASNPDGQNYLTIIIGGASGFISGVIASLLTPWAKWRVEKFRIRYNLNIQIEFFEPGFTRFLNKGYLIVATLV